MKQSIINFHHTDCIQFMKDKPDGFWDLAWTSFDCAARKFQFRWAGMLQQNMKNKQERIHPNEKPIDLMRWALNKYAKKGQKIFSPYGGGLGDAIACDIEGFDLDICENDLYYFNLGLSRFKEHRLHPVMFPVAATQINTQTKWI